MKKFTLLLGLLAVLATGLMANKCGDLTFNKSDDQQKQDQPKQ